MPQARGFFLSSTALIPLLGAPAPLPTVDLISAGVWNDSYLWVDTAIWSDGTPSLLDAGVWNDSAVWNDNSEWKDAA